jgi:hypothetical protein
LPPLEDFVTSFFTLSHNFGSVFFALSAIVSLLEAVH